MSLHKPATYMEKSSNERSMNLTIIMAKDPETGTLKPVTFYPKNIVKSPGGITTIQIGKVF